MVRSVCIPQTILTDHLLLIRKISDNFYIKKLKHSEKKGTDYLKSIPKNHMAGML